LNIRQQATDNDLSCSEWSISGVTKHQASDEYEIIILIKTCWRSNVFDIDWVISYNL